MIPIIIIIIFVMIYKRIIIVTISPPWVRLSLCFSDLCTKSLSGLLYSHSCLQYQDHHHHHYHHQHHLQVWTFITGSYQTFMMINCYV